VPAASANSPVIGKFQPERHALIIAVSFGVVGSFQTASRSLPAATPPVEKALKRESPPSDRLVIQIKQQLAEDSGSGIRPIAT